MGRQGTILVVDDNKSILKALELLLEKYFARTVMISSPNRIPTILREERIDLVLLDMNFSAGINNGNEGLFWLSRIIQAESGNQPLEGRMAVGNVVLNRVRSAMAPETMVADVAQNTVWKMA